MVIRVILLYNLEEMVPDLHRLVLEHKVVLVGQRPPDMAIGGKTGDHVAQIGVVLLVRHLGITPAIVGVEEDNICFDAQRAEFCHALFEVMEESDIVAGEIPAVALLFKRIILRLVFVKDVVFGENAHAQLVKAGSLQRLERLLFQRVALVDPGVTGRAEGEIRRAVLVAKMMLVAHTHRSVVALGGCRTGEAPGLSIECRRVALARIAPLAFDRRHKTYFIRAVSNVKTRCFDRRIAVFKLRAQLHVDKGIALRRPG